MQTDGFGKYRDHPNGVCQIPYYVVAWRVTNSVVIIMGQRINPVAVGSKGLKTFPEGQSRNETGQLKYSNG